MSLLFPPFLLTLYLCETLVSVKNELEKSINVSYGLMEKDLTGAVKSWEGRGGGNAERKEGKRLRSISRRGSSWLEQTEREKPRREREWGRCWKTPEDRLLRGDTKKAGNHEGGFPKQSSRLTYWTSLEVCLFFFFTAGCRRCRVE